MIWPKIPFKKLITYLDERIELEDMVEYITITVKRGHGGLVEREKLFGHQIKTKKQFRLIPGAFIISRVQCWHRAYAMVPDDLPANMIASSNYDQFAISPEVDHRFFWWLSHSPAFTESVRSSASGVVIEKMVFNREGWLEKTIPLPPLPEQRLIVAKIEALAARIGDAHNLRKDSEIDAGLLLHSALNYSCFTNKHPIQFFGDVLLEAKNGIYKPPHYWRRGIPCVRMYNIDGPGMNINNLQNLEVTKEEFDIYGCKPGDLIFNRVNSPELVGKTGIIISDYPTCTFESKNMRLRVDLSQTLPKYAVLILNSIPTKRFYRDVFKQQCGMATLNQSHVSKIPYPLPPLDEQRRIVAYLDSLQAQVDALKKLQAQTAAELGALLPAILDRAFKGEL